MPLPTPILDDRSYQQLRDELVRRIPVYAPEWTDHNASDPGIALIELFAFLGENLLFRFNQIPETTKLAFLRMLRVAMRPASAARALVAMSTKEEGGVLVPKATEAKAGGVPFETLSEVNVLPVSLQAMCRAKSAAPSTQEEKDFAARALDSLHIDEGRADWYKTAIVPLDPAAPDAEAVDFTRAIDQKIWIAVLGPKTLATGTAAEREEKRKKARSGLANKVLSVGFIPDEAPPKIEDTEACPGEGATEARHGVSWQASTGLFDTKDAKKVPRYLPVNTTGDSTRGLAQQGVVQIQLPRELLALNVFEVEDPDQIGTGDLPPEIEDAETAARVLFWLCAFRRRADAPPIGRVLWIGANACEVVQARKAQLELLGIGNGQADQRFFLAHKPVIQGSVRLQVEEPEGFRDWTEVDGFHASHEDDRHFQVDLEAGEVRFGNTIQGLAPQIGRRIRVSEYRYGGGPGGNVGAGAISKLVAANRPDLALVTLQNPLPARGGEAAERVDVALDRIPGELRRRDRAVTAGDFQELALATPGAEVGRAECLARFHAPTKKPDTPGVVSVVIWPREDLQNPNAPAPSRALLRDVCTYLDARRLVTTELYVIPPTYVKIAVSVGLKVKPDYGVDGVRRWVELVLRQYLAPLPPYGPDGRGWPLGRRVHGPELMAAALQVEGVEYLESEGLRVARLDDKGNWTEGTVTLAQHEVPELAEITVVEGAPLKPGVNPAPPSPGGDPKIPVPIPSLKVEC